MSTVYNDRHQITRHTRTDASYVNFGYDNLGQLTSAVGSGGNPLRTSATLTTPGGT